MNDLDVARIKDQVLEYLKDNNPHHEDLEYLYDTLKINKHTEIDIFETFIEDMHDDDSIKYQTTKTSHEIHLLPRGDLLINNGGYKKQLKEDLEFSESLAYDAEQEKEKRNLEIKYLKDKLASSEEDKREQALRIDALEKQLKYHNFYIFGSIVGLLLALFEIYKIISNFLS